MSEYRVRMTDTVEYVVVVEADSEGQAQQIAVDECTEDDTVEFIGVTERTAEVVFA